MPLYLSYDDTCRMLNQTIVQLNGRLTFISEVSRELMMKAVDASTGERFEAPADFHKIENPKDGRLGYINRPAGDALYIVRAAMRMYKMGLGVDNLVTMKGYQAERLMVHLGGVLEGIDDCYHNVFPSFEAALELAKEREQIVAYDRSFAVSPRGVVFYQTHKVGHTTGPKEDSIVWTKKGLLASFCRERPTLNWR